MYTRYYTYVADLRTKRIHILLYALDIINS